MTNKLMLRVEREVIEKALRDALTIRFDTDSHVTKLRALLDKQSCGACGGCDNGCKLDRESPPIEASAQHQGEPVAVVDLCKAAFYAAYYKRGVLVASAYKTIPVGTKLYAEQPAPVAVVMPDDWEDQLFAEMSRRFDLRKMIDDDHMVYDDTQIGVEFARDWIKARLNGVKP